MKAVGIKAFLSYSTKDKELAGSIKDFLGELGIDTFLAHETLEASDEWRREIRAQLKKRPIFLALLTPDSRQSDWVDQEIGMAIGLKKMVIPLPVEIPLYGFVAEFQAVDTSSRMDFGKDFWKIVRSVVKRFPTTRMGIRERTVRALCRSGNFHRSRDMVRTLENVFSPLTVIEKKRICRASGRNDQIGGFTEVRRFIRDLEGDIKRTR